MACCYSCIHLMVGADSTRRCRSERNALKVSRALEAACRRYILKPGFNGEIPVWYWGSRIPSGSTKKKTEVGFASEV